MTAHFCWLAPAFVPDMRIVDLRYVAVELRRRIDRAAAAR
jgi:hypothetical protein